MVDPNRPENLHEVGECPGQPVSTVLHFFLTIGIPTPREGPGQPSFPWRMGEKAGPLPPPPMLLVQVHIGCGARGQAVQSLLRRPSMVLPWVLQRKGLGFSGCDQGP